MRLGIAVLGALGVCCGIEFGETRVEAGERERILAAMQRVMGPFPGMEQRAKLEIVVEREEDAGAFIRRKLTYQSAPGERVPAWLLLPKGDRKKRPAMLALHQTTAAGKDEAAGVSGNPDLMVGRELAERGYVVLAPDYPTLGEHKIDVYARGWQSGSMKAIWDSVRGVDLLAGLQEVDSARIGVIGHSLGGHTGLFTAAFDKRIRLAVTNCGFTSFARYYGGNLAGWWGPRYMPRIKAEFPTASAMPFDFDDVLTAILPRRVYVSAPLRDGNFDVTGVRETLERVAARSGKQGYGGRITAVYPDCGHEWPRAEREAMYGWIDRAMKERR